MPAEDAKEIIIAMINNGLFFQLETAEETAEEVKKAYDILFYGKRQS